jgi:formylglycine-generating enzyme required for sulfatase activity
LPRGEDSLLSEQSTLIGPGSVRLTAPTGVVNVAILKVNRASGRDPNKVQGSPAPGSTAPAPAPAIVSVPQTRSVARGGTTTLFVSASGDNLSYQWKKNGADIAGATSAGLPLQNATGADEGNYTVVISNSEGSVTSAPIQVAVKMPAVPTGVYRINNSDGASGHEVALTGFSIDQHEVTKAFWDEVYAWAVANGYDFTNAGIAEGPEHPVHSVNWYDCVKWANALSERDGHTPCYYTDNNCTQVYRTGEVDLTNYNVRWNVDGYRLPTESEWEVAARGGLEGSKFAWGESSTPFDKHNVYQTQIGMTTPVGTFTPNGYGVFEIGGNLQEWTWDWEDNATYEFEFNERFTSEEGNLNTVNLAQTDAHYSSSGLYHPLSFSAQDSYLLIERDDQSYTNSGSYTLVKEFNISPCYIEKLENEIEKGSYYDNSMTCKVVFNYLNGTSAEILNSGSVSGFRAKEYLNPSPETIVKSIKVYLKSASEGMSSRERYTKVWAFPHPSYTRSITLDMPVFFEEKTTHFKIQCDSNKSGNNDIWFKILDDKNASKVFTYNEFGKFISIENPLNDFSKLKIYLQNEPNGWISINSIFIATSNPKSLWAGTKKIIRDNNYSGAINYLSKRNFSPPTKRYSTVGFRLVQRP